MNKHTRQIRFTRLVYLSVIMLTTLFLCSTAYSGIRSSLKGKVMKVSDGDTVVISPIEGGQFFKCRLFGIDAPETSKHGKGGQPYGEESAKELKKLILGQNVDVTLTGDKTYDREVCIIKKDGLNVNLEMVKKGYAWAYRRYLKRPHASEYIDAENEARHSKLGIWNDTNPTPPWEYRKAQKKKK